MDVVDAASDWAWNRIVERRRAPGMDTATAQIAVEWTATVAAVAPAEWVVGKRAVESNRPGVDAAVACAAWKQIAESNRRGALAGAAMKRAATR